MKVWLDRLGTGLTCLIMVPILIVMLPFVLVYELFFGLTREELEYYCLTTLEEGPKTGYEVLQGMEQLTGDKVLIGHGTVYVTLDRLIKKGLVKREKEVRSEDGKRIFKYSLTGKRVRLKVPEPKFSWVIGERIRQAFGSPAS